MHDDLDAAGPNHEQRQTRKLAQSRCYALRGLFLAQTSLLCTAWLGLIGSTTQKILPRELAQGAFSH